MVSQFTAVGGGVASLDSLQGIGTEANPASDNVALSTVDEYGTAIDTYTWNTWAAAAPCWVNDSYEPVTGVTIAPGQAFWTTGASDDQSIQSTGEVGVEDVVVSLRLGYTLVGNPFPVKIALQDLVAESSDEETAAASDNVAISTIDEYGTAIDTYTWNTWAAAEPCWVNDSYEPVNGVEFAPGEGLWASGTSEAQSIRFPAPEL